jgi:hypothetical protein
LPAVPDSTLGCRERKEMSFVTAATELMEAAAQDLAGIGSSVGEATAAAVAPTTGIAAAGADEVSAVIAQLFGDHGHQFQALAARAAAFHEQFVNLLSSGANSYLSTEVANAQHVLAGAVNGSARPLFGSGGAASFFSQSNLAAIEAPYQSLITNTTTNLQSLGSAISANPSPLLHQIMANQTGYAQTISTALQNAGNDISAGLPGFQASLQSAGQALQTGNINGAVGSAFQGLENLFLSGFDAPPVTGTDPITITPTGAVGDLLPIFSIPGQMAQNLANTVNTLTNFSTTFDPNTFGINFGTPLALTLDAVGSPITTLNALGSSAHAITSALQTGDLVGAIDGVLTAPANAANGFLNGQVLGSLPPVTLNLFGSDITTAAQIPFSGILAPPTPITIEFDGIPLQLLGGTFIGGLVPTLTGFLPQQIAAAIGAAATGA